MIKLGCFIPQRIKTNDDISQVVDTNDTWIVQRTGIKQRRICADHENALYMAQHAVQNLHLSTAEIALIRNIIVATSTPHRAMPSIASTIHGMLKCNTNVMAFDINDACNGFVQAMSIACQYSLNDTTKEYASLIIGVDHMSSIVDWYDRNTCILFGDGAGAIFLNHHNIQSFKQTSYTLSEYNNVFDCTPKISMDGHTVFLQAIQNIPKDILQLLNENNLSVNDIDYYIVHQANVRILTEVIRKFKTKDPDFDEAKVVIHMENTANTCAATIPLALETVVHHLTNGSRIIMSGFAAGLRGGSILIEFS